MSPDLRTSYLGLDLANPLVPRASPLGHRIETLRALQDAGAAAVVLPSMFEEQIEHEEIQLHGALETGTESFAEALTYMPEMADYNDRHRRLPAAPRGDRARARHPGDRQPQRHLARRLARVRPSDRGSRGRRVGAERVLHRGRQR